MVNLNTVAKITRAKTGKVEFQIGSSKATVQEAQKELQKQEDVKARSSNRKPTRIEILSGGVITGVTTETPSVFDARTEKGTLFATGTLADIRKATTLKSRAVQVFEKQRVTREAERIQPIKKTDISKKINTFTTIVGATPSPIVKGLLTEKQTSIPTIARLDIEKKIKFDKSLLGKTLTKLGKIEDVVSTKTGLKKVAERIESVGSDKQKRLIKDISAIQGKQDLNLIDKLSIAKSKTEIFTDDVLRKVITGTLKKPVTNSLLILSSAGLGKLAQTGKLSLSKLAATSPKLAKSLGISGSVASGALTVAYTTSIVNKGLNEFKTTGKLTKTTSDTLRELALFGAGAKLGTSKKTEGIIKLQKLINKLPKAQRIKIQNTINNKVKTLTSKEFGKLDVGIVTKLEGQQIASTLTKGVVGARLKSDVITQTANRLFIVRKGTAPKTSKSFNMEVLSIKGTRKDGFVLSKGFVQNVKAKFNPITKRVEIVKVLDVRIIENPINVRNMISKFDPSVKSVVVGKKFNVKPYEKTITLKKAVEIFPQLEISSKGIITSFKGVPLKKTIKVKGTVKEFKKVVSQEIKHINKLISGKPVMVEKGFNLVEFKPSAFTPKKVVKPKISKPVSLNKKFEELVIIGKEASLIVKHVKTETIVKPVIKKPVVSVTKIVSNGQELKVLPLVKEKAVSKPIISKVTPRTTAITKQIIIPKEIVKPVIADVKISLLKIIPKTVSKPVIKVGHKSKPSIKIKSLIVGVQDVRAAQILSIKSLLATKLAKPSLRASLISKPVKVVKPFFFTKTFLKPKSVVVKKPITKKPQVLFFTKTILRPSKKKDDNELFVKKKIKLFTGAELR